MSVMVVFTYYIWELYNQHYTNAYKQVVESSNRVNMPEGSKKIVSVFSQWCSSRGVQTWIPLKQAVQHKVIYLKDYLEFY